MKKNIYVVIAVIVSCLLLPVYGAAECTENALVSELPTSGLATDVCLNGILHVVSSSRVSISRSSEIPLSFATDMASKDAAIEAKAGLQKFVNSGDFVQTELYKKSLHEVFGAGTTSSTSKNAEGETEEKKSTASKTGGEKYSEYTYSEQLRSKALRGIFMLKEKFDENFAYVTVAISEKSIATAQALQSANMDKSNPSNVGNNNANDADSGSSIHSYSDAIPPQEWVNPLLRKQ